MAMPAKDKTNDYPFKHEGWWASHGAVHLLAASMTASERAKIDQTRHTYQGITVYSPDVLVRWKNGDVMQSWSGYFWLN